MIASISAATPLVRSTRAQRCRRRWTSSHSASPADATRSAVQPRNGVSAAERARVDEAGRSIASSTRSQSRAGTVPKTLPAPLMTAGMPAAIELVAHERRVAVRAHEHGDVAGTDAARGASRAGAALADLDDRAATTAGATRSAARSCAMCSRTDGVPA